MPNLENVRQLISRLETFTSGGEWAVALPDAARKNLSYYWFDGLFAAASDTIPINYLTLYLLAVGANSSQVGLLSSLTSLAAAACLLPGALLVERYGHRQKLTLWFGGGMARIALLGLALLPLGFGGQALIWGVILLAVLRSAVGNLAYPAWMSLTGDIVPMNGRGRYFGSRNIVMGIASVLMTYLVGEFITRIGSPQGYQLALLMAFGVGLLSTYSFSRIKDPQTHPQVQSAVSLSLPEMWKGLCAAPGFLAFCFAAAVWNFFINVAGPFFNVYMVQNLSFTAAMVGLTAVTMSISRMLLQKKIGELSDRWGAGRVQMVSMFLIPILPLGWIFITQLWQVVVLNTLGGVLWGAFELVSFNFLLQLTPNAQRARYSAIYQIVVTVALGAGAAVGSGIIYWWGYTALFLVSAFGRVVAAFLFLRLMRGLERRSQASSVLDVAELP